MKWKFKRIYLGDTRIIKKFLILPVTMEYEVRWLETVYIEELYCIDGWSDNKWSTKEKYEDYIKQK
jgi:hypothetical protein